VASNRRGRRGRALALRAVLIVAVAVAWLALVALGLSLCRQAARSELTDAVAVADRLVNGTSREAPPAGDSTLIEPRRTRATRGL
jgi:hypothetical protein